MREDRYLRWVIRLLWTGLVLAALWAGLRWLLPLAAPFLLAAVLAWLLEPVVRFFTVRCRLPRRLAAALCVLAAAGLLTGIGGLLLWRLWYELAQLAGRLPALLAELGWLTHQMESWLYRLFVALPDQLREPARQAAESLGQSLLALPGWLGESVVSRVVQALAGLPSAGPGRSHRPGGRPAHLRQRCRPAALGPLGPAQRRLPPGAGPVPAVRPGHPGTQPAGAQAGGPESGPSSSGGPGQYVCRVPHLWRGRNDPGPSGHRGGLAAVDGGR